MVKYLEVINIKNIQVVYQNKKSTGVSLQSLIKKISIKIIKIGTKIIFLNIHKNLKMKVLDSKKKISGQKSKSKKYKI